MGFIQRLHTHRARICKRLWSPGIDSDGPIPPAYVAWRAGTTNRVVVEYRAGIFKKSMGARNRGGIRLLYRTARLHRLAEFIPWNQFRGPINI
jgi:hypothetical protein